MKAATPREGRRRLGPMAVLPIGAILVGLLATLIGGALGSPSPALAATAQDPSNVVLVFDVSNSILLSEDGTNTQFAGTLQRIADRVEESTDDLVAGNAEISIVVFGRTAVIYPQGCGRLALNEDPEAVAQLATCLRSIAAEYEAGADAPVRDRINTQDTDHVAALRRAANILPDQTTRSAVIFFTDGQHDPPGTTRDDENVVAEIAAAYEGQSPLAILPVGLGARAGAFEAPLRSLFDAYFRDMEPCVGRAAFAWPQVAFASADEAGIAVASALQEVTCSFVFVPPPSATPIPSPTPVPTPTPAPPGAPRNVQLLAGNESITVQWLEPGSGLEGITDYLVRCRPDGSGEDAWIESTEGVSLETEAVVEGLQPGTSYGCEVAATDGVTPGPYAAATGSILVLGIPPAPGQPRAEPRDGAVVLSVDPIAGGAPAESYIYECSNAAGQKSGAAGPQPAVTVTGLVNGDTYTCVAYAENRIGRSDASMASAAFSPCAGIFACSPLLAAGIGIGVLLVGLVAALIGLRMYRRRNRVWVTAQVDGGPNLPLGWGPDVGVRLERGDGGELFAAARPFEGAEIKARYTGKGRFLVNSRGGMHDVHQGDPAPVRDEEGRLHQLILRRYRSRPDESPRAERRQRRARSAPAEASTAEVTGRLEGREEEAPPSWDGQPPAGSKPADTA